MQNILVCQDIMKQYNQKHKPARCTIKVDLRKAYDSISWDFLKEMMQALNFNEQLIKWIMQCISTTYFSLSWWIAWFHKREEGAQAGRSHVPPVVCLGYGILYKNVEESEQH